MEITILHEMVHWGDEIFDRVKQPDDYVYNTITGRSQIRDVGFQFEEQAYPGIFMADLLNRSGIKVRGLN